MFKKHLSKKHEMSVGSDTINVDFLGSNRQFVWLEITLVFDESDKHTTIYDNYNTKLATKYIKTIKLSNFTEYVAQTMKRNMIPII